LWAWAGGRGVAWAAALLLAAEALNSLGHWPSDSRRLWLDLRPLPAGIQAVLVAAGAVGLVWMLLLPPASPRRRRWFRGALLLVAFGGGLRPIAFYADLVAGRFEAAIPAPLSLGVCLIALAQARGLAATPAADPARRRPLGEAANAAVAASALVFLQMVVFGGVSAAVPADAVVVFGAKAHADGAPSLALYDRVRTGCALYRRGLARFVVLSGGPGEGFQTEAQVMRRLALGWGIPAGDIVLDDAGVNTRATVVNVRRLMAEREWRQVLLVSHSFHLARVALCCDRAGVRGLTVPAWETRPLRNLLFYMARETVAWAFYEVRSLFVPFP
jgi:uncharacterized SAM-binding protein YcdF (DUF218 family)